MEFLEYNKREIQTHLLSLILVSSLKLYYKEVLFVFFCFVKDQKSCKLVQISKIAQNYPTIFKISSNVEPVLMR